MEIWRNIEGYEGLYQVSNLGRIYSLRREKILAGGIDTSGYIVVTLYKNGKGKTKTVHRLVAKAFIENPKELPVINHKDENKTNNHITNLEWCTIKYNINYSKNSTQNNKKTLSERMKGNKNAKARKVRCVTTNEEFDCIAEAGRKYNVGKSEISKVCKRKRKTAGKDPITGEKLKWEYIK